MNADDAGALVMAVHIVRRIRDIRRTPGCRPPPDVAELHTAAELRLRDMTALELVEALIDYRYATGIPLKL